MKKYFILGLLILFHLFLLVNLRFTAWPEMFSYPYLRNSGYLLYKDMIHPYPPLLTMTLSFIFKIFGYKLIVLKLFTWMLILVVDVLIFFIAKVLTKNIKYSVFALIFYVIAQPFLDGNMLWFDLAIVPSILLGALFLLNKKYFLAGAAFAIALLTKQTAGVFIIFTFLYLIFRKSKIRDLISFLVGPVVLGLVLVLRLITENTLGGFINWTLIYPLAYWSKFPGYVQIALTNRQLFILALLLIPALLLIFKLRRDLLLTAQRQALLMTKSQALLMTKSQALLIISYFLLSTVLIYPRFSFFHFQTALAFLVIIYGTLLSKIKIRPFFLYSYFLILFLLICRPILKTDWHQETRFWSKEDLRLANIIRSSTKPEDKVYLLGPHSGLYVMADRLPPKPWSDNFGWYLEVPGIQEEIIESWKNNQPKIVFTSDPQPGNWYDLGTYRPQKILDWIKEEKIDENRLY